MAEPQSPPPGASPADDRLDSWKDIAAYLGREVRTAQLWEKNEGLPVHRHQHSRQGSVYAFRSELDAWRQIRASLPEPVPAGEPEPLPPASARPLPAKSQARLRWAVVGLLLIAAATGGAYIWSARSTASGSGPSAVAVLPFVDMSAAKDQEYFSDGLTEEIIDALSRVPNLHVVARTSAFAYKGKNSDIRTIAQQLNVDAVLEGSVRKSGDQLRITAQLNRASDGFHYWSQTYDRPLKDVFGVQREISQAIANQLRAGKVSGRQPTSDLEAYRLYQEARYFFNQFTGEAFHKAIDRYQQAIARDRQFALAYAGLADAYSYLAEFSESPPGEVMPKAREAAERAVALDASLGEAHTALGLVKLDYEWDRPAAEREFLRAGELNPSSSWVHHWLGHLREAQLRLDDATAEMQAAMKLDPLSEPLHWDLANDLLLGGRSAETRAMLNKAHELFPNNPAFVGFLATVDIRTGDLGGAESAIKMLSSGYPQTNPSYLLAEKGFLAAKQGHRADAEAALQKLEQLRRQEFVDGTSALEICVALGDRKCAMLWLGRMHDEHSANFVYLPLYYREQLELVPEAQQLLTQIK